MGMYTAFHFFARLQENLPKDVVDILTFLIEGNTFLIPLTLSIPDHPFFKCERWRFIADADNSSFSCDTITINGDLKNYDHEIQHFIDWISKYIYRSEYYDRFAKRETKFAGYYLYEEDREPTLIYV